MTNEIATTPDSPLAALLSDPAQLKDYPIETVERMFAMYQQDQQDRRAQEYAQSMARVKANMTPVPELHRNPSTGSMYAKIEDVQAMIDPLLTAEAITYSSSTVPCDLPDHLRVRMVIRHPNGYLDEHFLEVPIDDKGIKQQANKTRMHGMGSSMTYAARYLLCNVMGVQVGEDIDGNRPESAETVSEEQVANLKALMEEVNANAPNFLKYLRVKSLDELPVSKYAAAVRSLEEKRS